MSTTGQDPAPPQSLLSTILESRQLLNPFRWILCAVYFLPHTIINQLLSGHLPIPGPRLHEAWFGRFWAWMGPNVKEMATPAVVPLLKDAKGTVLEVGAGNGQWMNCYPDKVTKVVAVEPNPMSVMQMRKAIVENGKEEVYVVVPNGVEGLAGVDGLKKGSVDTIVTVLSLCSVPMPKETIRELYGYLKPGGKWLLFEHVQAPRPNDITGWWQRKSQ